MVHRSSRLKLEAGTHGRAPWAPFIALRSPSIPRLSTLWVRRSTALGATWKRQTYSVHSSRLTGRVTRSPSASSRWHNAASVIPPHQRLQPQRRPMKRGPPGSHSHKPERPATVDVALLARVGSDTGTRAASVGRPCPPLPKRGRPALWTVHQIQGGTRSDGGGRLPPRVPATTGCERPRRKAIPVASGSRRKKRPPSRGNTSARSAATAPPCVSWRAARLRHTAVGLFLAPESRDAAE
jgi:hypothetical protein